MLLIRLSFGASLITPNKIYVGLANELIVSLSYASASFNMFTVTIVDNLGNPVANTQVHCTTNGQNYTTNSSGQIPQVIETESSVKLLTFTWSTSGMGSWITANGSLQQRSSVINNYTGTATLSSGNEFNGNCSTTVQTSTTETNYRIDVPASAGNTVTIGTQQYVIAHVDAGNVYVALMYCNEKCQFDSSSSHVDYSGSDIAAKCSSHYSSNVPSVWRVNAAAFIDVVIDMVTGKCFIPTKDQFGGDWDYFNSDNRRIFYELDGSAIVYWTSNNYSSSRMYTVNVDGKIIGAGGPSPSATYGFRPALAIKRSLFTS